MRGLDTICLNWIECQVVAFRDTKVTGSPKLGSRWMLPTHVCMYMCNMPTHACTYVYKYVHTIITCSHILAGLFPNTYLLICTSDKGCKVTWLHVLLYHSPYNSSQLYRQTASRLSPFTHSPIVLCIWMLTTLHCQKCMQPIDTISCMWSQPPECTVSDC